jgi:hypothetical protein
MDFVSVVQDLPRVGIKGEIAEAVRHAGHCHGPAIIFVAATWRFP